MLSASSIDVQELIRVQQHLAEVRQRRRRGGRVASGLLVEELDRSGTFRFARFSTEGLAVGHDDLSIVFAARFGLHAASELRGMGERVFAVDHQQRLSRSRRHVAFGGA